MATIRILVERGRVADLLHSYAVVLDGRKIGRIRSGETVHVPVSDGVHTIRFVCGLLISPPVKFVVDVAVTSIICRPNMWRAMGLFALFAPRSWVRVREETDQSLTAALQAAGPESVLRLQDTPSWSRPLPKAIFRRKKAGRKGQIASRDLIQA